MDASTLISTSPPAPPRLPTLYPRPPSLPQQHQSLSATTANFDLDLCYPMDDDFAHAHGHGHGQTCVPSLIPPGTDPAHVDMRTFYPYQPNEVKHRKRTTRQQLRVLEDVYKGDTKPNAGLRKKLAEELSMTPRGVQVWFQNRRAKTKSQNRKAEQAIALGVPPPGGNGSNNDSNNNNNDGNASASIAGTHTNGKSATEPIDLTEPQASVDVKLDAERGRSAEKLGSVGDIQTEASTETSSAISLTVDSAPEWSPSTAATSPNTNIHSSPASPDVSVNGNNSANSNVQSPPMISSQAFPLSSSLSPSSSYLDPQAMTHALAARRPSLPVLSFSGPGNSTSPSMNGNGGVYRTPSGFDPAQRRKSIDVSRRMLGGHPYAHLAQNTNAALYPAASSPSATWDNQSPNGTQNVSPRVSRQGVRHGSMPHVFQNAGFDAHGHGKETRHAQFLSPQTAARRPGFSTRLSMPSSPQPPPAMLLNRRYASFSLAQQSSSPPQLPATSFGMGGVGEGYEFPGQAHMQRRRRQASPGGRSPPPPIAQFSNNHGSAGASGMEMYVPARPVAEPIPGPLPDASYSFGMPATEAYASSGSQEGEREREGSGSRGGSSAGSPSPTTSSATLHARAGTGSHGAGLGSGSVLGLTHGLGGGVQRGAGEDEADDDSLSPPGSTYPWSRNGSLASTAGSETSWTSWSEVGSAGGSGDAKEGVQEYADGRRPSIFLPQMFSGLGVGNSSGGNGDGTNTSNSGGQNQEAAGEGATPQPSGPSEADSSNGSSTLAANGEVQRRASVDVPAFEGENAWQDAYPPVPGYGGFMRHGHGHGLSHGTPAEVQDTRMGGELPLLYQKFTVAGVNEEHVSPHTQPPAYYAEGYAPQTASDAYGQGSPPEAFTQQSTPDFAQQSPPETFAQQPAPEGFAQQASPEGYAHQTASEGYGAMYGAYGVPLEYPAYTAWGVPVYSSGAIELDRMCVPSALTMETIGEYAMYGAQ